MYGVEIAQYLEINGLGVQAQTIYVGDTPSTPDNVLVVFPLAGWAPDKTHNQQGISYSNPRLQILVRDTSYANGWNKANAASRLLARVKNTTLSGIYYVHITPAHEPEQLPRDENRRWLFVQNFDVKKKPE